MESEELYSFFSRYAMSAPLFLQASLNKSPKKAKSRSAHTRLILISLFQALFISSYMYSIKLIPLSLAVVVIYTFPIITFFVNSLIKSRSIDLLSVAALYSFAIWYLGFGSGGLK